jgi:hypothetical protein
MRISLTFTRFEEFPNIEQFKSIDVGICSTRLVNGLKFLSVLAMRHLVRKSDRTTRYKLVYVSGFN